MRNRLYRLTIGSHFDLSDSYEPSIQKERDFPDQVNRQATLTDIGYFSMSYITVQGLN